MKNRKDFNSKLKFIFLLSLFAIPSLASCESRSKVTSEETYLLKFNNNSSRKEEMLEKQSFSIINEFNQSLQFFAKNVKENEDGFICLSRGGSFGNKYIKEVDFHGQIMGLKSIIVDFDIDHNHDNIEETLVVNYSYESELSKGHYVKTSQRLKSKTPYYFDNNYPTYFLLYSDQAPSEKIQDLYISTIEITYTNNKEKEKIPSFYHSSNFDIGPLFDVPFKAVASNLRESYDLIEEAIVRHYPSAEITYNFDIGNSYLYISNNFSHVSISLVGNQNRYKGAINTYKFNYLGDSNNENPIDIASMYQNPTKENTFKMIPNANYNVRLNYLREHDMLRDEKFNDFRVEKLDDSKTMPIYHSEDLWWALLHDYKPTFPLQHSKAEWMYNEAKQILRENIIDSMSNFEKLRAIYEWMIEETQYDFDGLASSLSPCVNTCYFLEGTFERRLAVCDSFSKAFILLAKIEGLDVKRGLGYGKTENHAWVYARTNDNEPYYLICPTWGDTMIEVDKIGTTRTLINYEAFMTSTTYYLDKSKTQEEETYYRDYQAIAPLASEPYNESLYKLDKLPSNPKYDHYIDDKDEFRKVTTETLKVMKGDFAFYFELCDSLFNDKGINDLFDIFCALSEISGKSRSKYQFGRAHTTLYDVTCLIFFVIE